MTTDVEVEVRGTDGFMTRGSNRLSRISRDPRALVAQAMGRTHQYPDGLALFLGTMFVPTADRGSGGRRVHPPRGRHRCASPARCWGCS